MWYLLGGRTSTSCAPSSSRFFTLRSRSSRSSARPRVSASVIQPSGGSGPAHHALRDRRHRPAGDILEVPLSGLALRPLGDLVQAPLKPVQVRVGSDRDAERLPVAPGRARSRRAARPCAGRMRGPLQGRHRGEARASPVIIINGYGSKGCQTAFTTSHTMIESRSAPTNRHDRTVAATRAASASARSGAGSTYMLSSLKPTRGLEPRTPSSPAPASPPRRVTSDGVIRQERPRTETFELPYWPTSA